jgi:hypothetical protein
MTAKPEIIFRELTISRSRAARLLVKQMRGLLL